MRATPVFGVDATSPMQFLPRGTGDHGEVAEPHGIGAHDRIIAGKAGTRPEGAAVD